MVQVRLLPKGVGRKPVKEKEKFMSGDKRYFYSVATGLVTPGTPEADSMLTFARGQGGLKSVHPTKDGILWMYDSLNHAKIARNILTAAGIRCGYNICRFRIDGTELVYEEAVA